MTPPDIAPDDVDPSADLSLRRLEAARLESYIGFMRKRQVDLNRKMEEYIQGLRCLLRTLSGPPDSRGPAR